MYRKKFSRARRRRIRRAAASAAAAVICVIFLVMSPVCAVTDVKMNGNYHETEEEVTGLLGRGPASRSSILLFLFNRGRKVGGNTFVDTLTVDLDNLHSVTVNVNEKKLIGCVEYEDRYWYFNRSGTVLVSREMERTAPQQASAVRPAVSANDSAEEMAAPGSEGTAPEAQHDSSGALSEEITDVVELSSGPGLAGNLKIIYLSADPVLYGEEFTEDAAVSDEDMVGEGELLEDVPAEEDEVGSEEGTAQEERTDTEETEAGPETGEELPAAEEPETYDGEIPAEAPAEETDGAGEAPAEEINPEAVIQPSVVTEEDMPSGQAGQEAQTWEIDTSAKGGNYLPVVRGLVFSEAAIGYPLPVQYDRVFSSIAVLKSFVDRSGYVPDDVSYDDDGNLTVTYGRAVINLGRGENIESRVSVMGKTLPSIAGLSGTLHLENCDGTQNRFIFSKN